MPLISYEQYITLPDGSPAANMAQLVQLLGGNIAIPLFADKAATLPLTNPVMTDGDGLATFYAAPGSFITELAGATFHFIVSATEPDDAWPGVFVHVQAAPSTTWTIEHHIGAPPAVTVLNASGARVECTVTHTDAETTVLTFSPAQSGTALLRR